MRRYPRLPGPQAGRLQRPFPPQAGCQASPSRAGFPVPQRYRPFPRDPRPLPAAFAAPGGLLAQPFEGWLPSSEAAKATYAWQAGIGCPGPRQATFAPADRPLKASRG